MHVAEYAFGIQHDSAVRFPVRTVFGITGIFNRFSQCAQAVNQRKVAQMAIGRETQ